MKKEIWTYSYDGMTLPGYKKSLLWDGGCVGCSDGWPIYLKIWNGSLKIVFVNGVTLVYNQRHLKAPRSSAQDSQLHFSSFLSSTLPYSHRRDRGGLDQFRFNIFFRPPIIWSCRSNKIAFRKKCINESELKGEKKF